MESVFHALAHPARRQALRYLARESLTAGDLAARFDAAAPTMSRHFSILKEADLIREVKFLAESGVRMVGLGALGYDARPEYHKATASKCRKVGMDVLVCTPEKLAESMATIIRG